MEFVTESKEMKDNKNWSNLPREIVESILKRLCLRDYLQFGEVCTYWQIIVADAIATKHCLPAPQAQLPVMITCSGENSKVFSLTTKKLILPKRPLFAENQHCRGTIKGWLIMFDSSLWSLGSDSVSIDPHSSPFFFLNPVSNVRINLPRELTFPQQFGFAYGPFCKMAASSSPNCKDCTIAGLCVDFQRLAFCMLEDKSWTIIKSGDANMSFRGVEILNSKLYVLVRQGVEWLLRTYDLQNPNTTGIEVFETTSVFRGVFSNKRTVDNINYINNYSICYLSKNDVSGELLLIRGLYDFSFKTDSSKIIDQAHYILSCLHPPSTKELQLWKYQYNDSQWIEIDDLGDCSIFLGTNGFTVTSISHLTHQEFVERNSVYHVHWESSSDSSSLPFELKIGTFSLTEKSMKYLELIGMETQHMKPFQWFIPTLP